MGGSDYRIGEEAVYMPSFERGHTDVEIAAPSNFVLGYFSGKPGVLTAQDIARSHSP